MAVLCRWNLLDPRRCRIAGDFWGPGVFSGLRSRCSGLGSFPCCLMIRRPGRLASALYKSWRLSSSLTPILFFLSWFWNWGYLLTCLEVLFLYLSKYKTGVILFPYKGVYQILGCQNQLQKETLVFSFVAWASSSTWPALGN